MNADQNSPEPQSFLSQEHVSEDGTFHRVLDESFLQNITGTILIIVFLLNLYTNWSPAVQPRIPGVLCFLSGGALLLMNMSRIQWGAVLGILGCTFISFFSAVFSPAPADFFQEHMLSLIQFIGALLGVYGLALELEKWSPARFKRTMLAIVVVLAVLATLEVLTPFVEISDRVRAVLYEGAFLYDSDLRDILLHGAIRPKVFSQEPSHVARFVAIALIAWWSVNREAKTNLIGLLLLVWLIVIIRSPTLIMVPMIVFAYKAFEKRQRPVGGAVVLGVLLTFGLLIVALPVVIPLIGGIFIERIDAIISFEDASTIIRIFAPLELVFDVSTRYPAFGAGIGGKELVADDLLTIFAQYPAVNLAGLLADDLQGGWGSALLEFPIYYGLLGSGVMTICMFVFLRSLFPISKIMLVISFAVIFGSISGFVTIRPWAYLIILLAAFTKGHEVTNSNSAFEDEIDAHQQLTHSREAAS